MVTLLDDVRRLSSAIAAEGAEGAQGARVGPAEHTREADAERVELIAAMERAKSALCAAQADLAVGLDASVRDQQAADGVLARHRGRGVAAQVALARRVSPHRGQVLLGLAKDLATDLPATRQALRQGRLDEHRALLLARETGCLEREDRAVVEEAVCGRPNDPDDPDRLDELGPRGLVGELRRRVYAADPAAVVRRARRAESERRVSLRPAPDGMAYLTALLPLARAVSCYAALGTAADRHRATGDPRGRGALMADLLVERLTGQARADQTPVCIDLVISDATLLGAGHEPATIPGWGPVPAQIARELAARAHEATQAWVRRLYTDPAGRLIALTTRQRLVTEGLATYLDLRDQGTCRTPWCDAPARHADHVLTAAQGGPTDAENTQGLCEACNHATQAPGWRQRTDPTGRHVVETTTPTGHRHRSHAPDPPLPAHPPTPHATRLEIAFRELLLA